METADVAQLVEILPTVHKAPGRSLTPYKLHVAVHTVTWVLSMQESIPWMGNDKESPGTFVWQWWQALYL